MTDTLFVTPREAWRRSGLPRDEVYRRLKTGELPSLKLGNRYGVPVRALELLVGQLCEQDSGPRPAA